MGDRLTIFLSKSNPREVFQSDYKQFHSMETALLKVQNDLLKTVYSDVGAILVLLFLVAFVTIDHDDLLQRLHDLGVLDLALLWLKSYLSDRHQCVYIKGQRSHEVRLPFGVPQGSVFGPIPLALFTSPPGPIASANGLKYHLHADDTQLYLYISFKPSSKLPESYALKYLEKFAGDMKEWLTKNYLN